MSATKRATVDAEWVSLAEAARQIGKTRQTVLGLAVKGELEAAHIGGRTLITADSVRKYLSAQTAS